MTTTASEPETSARPMRKDAARNRELLIAAAREVFARRGLDASLDDVARQAGVGVGTAYRHFANKYELAEAIMQQGIDEVIEHARLAAAAADPWHGLVGFLEAVLKLQTSDRGLREVTMGMHDQEKADEVHDLLIGPLTTLLERAQETGAVRADVRPSDLGVVMMMLCVAGDLGGDAAPLLWRRYLPGLLGTLRPGGAEMDVPALDDAQFRVAAAAYKSQAGCAPAPVTP
jgi:AcrR family transcriptional regulator